MTDGESFWESEVALLVLSGLLSQMPSKEALLTRIVPVGTGEEITMVEGTTTTEMYVGMEVS